MDRGLGRLRAVVGIAVVVAVVVGAAVAAGVLGAPSAASVSPRGPRRELDAAGSRGRYHDLGR